MRMSARTGVCVCVAIVSLAACKKPPAKVIAPQPIENAMPAADRIAQTQAAKDGKAGKTVIAYCIATDGTTQDVKVTTAFEPSFDALALETVRAWTFRPASKDGVPYEECTDIDIEYRPPPPES
jgi:TonB family protein